MISKDFVTKFISRVKPSISKIRSFPKLLAIGIISLISILSASTIPGRSTIAYAQTQLTDPIQETIKIAQSKVEAATAEGAFGHGVPSIYNMSNHEIMLVFGIAAVVGILSYAIYRVLMERRNKDNNIEMTLTS